MVMAKRKKKNQFSVSFLHFAVFPIAFCVCISRMGFSIFLVRSFFLPQKRKLVWEFKLCGVSLSQTHFMDFMRLCWSLRSAKKKIVRFLIFPFSQLFAQSTPNSFAFASFQLIHFDGHKSSSFTDRDWVSDFFPWKFARFFHPPIMQKKDPPHQLLSFAEVDNISLANRTVISLCSPTTTNYNLIG